MQPKEKLNKMKTFPSMNPKGSKLTVAVIDEFISQQNNMLDLLNQAQNVNLTKTKTNIFKIKLYNRLKYNLSV
mgnify:CR=1 FL=1